jgi:hypothetical protein
MLPILDLPIKRPGRFLHGPESARAVPNAVNGDLLVDVRVLQVLHEQQHAGGGDGAATGHRRGQHDLGGGAAAAGAGSGAAAHPHDYDAPGRAASHAALVAAGARLQRGHRRPPFLAPRHAQRSPPRGNQDAPLVASQPLSPHCAHMS